MSEAVARAGYEGPEGSRPYGLPLSEMKQQISFAYVHMVTAAAGCSLKDHRTDYDGVDVTVVSSVNYEVFYDPQFELQVKCTSQRGLIREDHVAWSMARGPFLKLTNPQRYTPAYLGLLVVPEDPAKWLTQDEENLIARSALYWQRATELGAIDADAGSKTVHVPTSNLFDVSQLLGIMRTIGEGGD